MFHVPCAKCQRGTFHSIIILMYCYFFLAQDLIESYSVMRVIKGEEESYFDAEGINFYFNEDSLKTSFTQ